MRALLDTNAIDPLLEQPGAIEALEAAVAAGALTLLIPPTVIDEPNDTPS